MSKHDHNPPPTPPTERVRAASERPRSEVGELHVSWEHELEAMAASARDEAIDWEQMFGQITTQISTEPRRSRWYELPTSTRYILLFLLAGLLTAMVAVFKLRPDFAQYPPLRMGLLVGTFSVLLALHIWILLRPLHKAALPAWFTHIFLPAAGLLAPLALALLPTPYHPPHYVPASTGIFVKHTMICLVLGLLLAAPFLFTTHLFARYKPELAFIGMSAAAGGLLANLGLQLLCPKESPLHLLAGHATIGLLLLGALLLLQRRASAKADAF